MRNQTTDGRRSRASAGHLRGRLVIALLGLGFAPGAAGAGQAEIRWNELAAVIVGHDVSIPLPEGELATGQALAVRDQSLMLDIGKTSDPSRYPKGPASIPRASITEVRVLQQRGAGGRILGSVVGALVGIVGGAEIAVHGTRTEAAGVATFSAVAVAGTVGGYYLGRSVDRRWTQLRIAPSSAASGLPAAGDKRVLLLAISESAGGLRRICLPPRRH